MARQESASESGEPLRRSELRDCADFANRWSAARSRWPEPFAFNAVAMNRSLLKSKSPLLGLWTILICYLVSCAPRAPSEVEKLRANQFVSEDVILSVTNGSSFAEVRKTFGSAVRHQFTIVENGHTWTLIMCFLHTGEEESYTFYQLLFRDGELAKTIGWIQMEREEYPYQGTTATRSKPWEIEDMKYVNKAIDAPAVTQEQIRADLKEARATMEKFKGQGNIPAVVLSPFAHALVHGANKEFPINEELRQRYDGCRASIGMTVQQVDALYGQPLRVFTTKTGRVARVYGDRRYSGDMDHFLMFSYVAVLFDPKGNLASIFSGAFFCNDWDPDMPLGRRG